MKTYLFKRKKNGIRLEKERKKLETWPKEKKGRREFVYERNLIILIVSMVLKLCYRSGSFRLIKTD